MEVAFAEIERQAMKLDPSERAVLAQHLITSLEGLDELENERLWVEEAERHYQEYKKSRISSRPSKDVFDNALNRFK